MPHGVFAYLSRTAFRSDFAALSVMYNYATLICRRPIKMSPVCQLEMTLPGGFPGGVGGDDTTDERSGAFAAGGSAGFGPKATDDESRGPASGARAASGVSAVEGRTGHGQGGGRYCV